MRHGHDHITGSQHANRPCRNMRSRAHCHRGQLFGTAWAGSALQPARAHRNQAGQGYPPAKIASAGQQLPTPRVLAVTRPVAPGDQHCLAWSASKKSWWVTFSTYLPTCLPSHHRTLRCGLQKHPMRWELDGQPLILCCPEPITSNFCCQDCAARGGIISIGSDFG